MSGPGPFVSISIDMIRDDGRVAKVTVRGHKSDVESVLILVGVGREALAILAEEEAADALAPKAQP